VEARSIDEQLTPIWDEAKAHLRDRVNDPTFRVFFERAVPGTFADWQLARFTDAQLTNSLVGTAAADPDGDGVPNLLEFAVGGNPLVADGAATALQPLSSAPGSFSFSFRERKNLGDVQRLFESSTNLVDWVGITPSSLVMISNLPDVYLSAAAFPVQDQASFFRLRSIL